MKLRLIFLAISLTLIIAALAIVSIIFGSRPVENFSSPDEIRTFALADYDTYFSKTTEKTPDVSSSPPAPVFTLDTSDPGELKVTWHEVETNKSIAQFGQRIGAPPETQSFELPNGQIITLVGFAFSPRADRLFDPDDPARYGSEKEINWIDPVTYEPIADPASRKLPATTDVEPEPQLLFAFDCTDKETRPVRWHWARLYDQRTRVSVIDSSSRQSTPDGLILYKVDLKIAHSAPVRMLLPVSYGEAEVIEVDPESTGSKFTFGKNAAELEILYSRDGQRTGSSSSGGYGSRPSQSTFRIRETKPDERWRNSFSLICIWPPIQGHTVEYSSNNGKSWTNYHPNNDINSITFDKKLKDIPSLKFRQFPHLARGIFEIEKIPGLPELDNLFTAKVGPVRFDYDGSFRRAISDPTMTTWSFHKDQLPSSAFPISFDDPDITPDQLLKEYSLRIGVPLSVDEVNHSISRPTDETWPEKAKKWLRSVARRFF